MTGRQLYERFCELRLKSPDWDWWKLTSADREAWDQLADFASSTTRRAA